MSTLESKVIEIPAESYIACIDESIEKEKIEQIRDLFTNYNKLRSKEELREINQKLQSACTDGDIELIKIYLSETIQNETKELTFKIDETTKTASLFKVNEKNVDSIIIPRTIKHKSVDYLITSICGTGYLFRFNIPTQINTIKFADDSAVETFYNGAFSWSSVKEIYFPNSLKVLKKGWCSRTYSLVEIITSPLNDQFLFKDGKFLLGKSDKNNSDYDILLFARRDIEDVFIPSNIKIISAYSFSSCHKIRKFEFQPNSNLQIIESYAFEDSSLNEIIIPPSVSKICKYGFHFSLKLTKVVFTPNSNLQTIEKYAFSESNLKEILVPSKVTKICEYAFNFCQNLTKIKFPPDSNLQTIKSCAFLNSAVEELYFPKNLKHLEKRWCLCAYKLKKIIVSPCNSHFIFKDDKLLLGKSDQNKEEFDILLFARRDIEEISIPSTIKIISSGAFNCCRNLRKVEFPPNSNLQKIGLESFGETNLKEILIPSNVSKVSKRAFYRNCSLVKVVFPTNSNLQKIKSDVFSDTIIESIFIPAKVSIVCKCAFQYCKKLKKVEIPTNSNLQTIGSNAFSWSKIKSIFIPSKVSKICENTFQHCYYLQIVEISEESKLESFPLSAFNEKSKCIIMIPASLEKLIHIIKLI